MPLHKGKYGYDGKLDPYIGVLSGQDYVYIDVDNDDENDKVIDSIMGVLDALRLVSLNSIRISSNNKSYNPTDETNNVVLRQRKYETSDGKNGPKISLLCNANLLGKYEIHSENNDFSSSSLGLLMMRSSWRFDKDPGDDFADLANIYDIGRRICDTASVLCDTGLITTEWAFGGEDEAALAILADRVFGLPLVHKDYRLKVRHNIMSNLVSECVEGGYDRYLARYVDADELMHRKFVCALADSFASENPMSEERTRGDKDIAHKLTMEQVIRFAEYYETVMEAGALEHLRDGVPIEDLLA